MTTVSVQPTTSEPNEREAFGEWYRANFERIKNMQFPRETAWAAWQHQQNRIDELEASLERKDQALNAVENIAESLQTKLNEIETGYLRTQESTARISESYLDCQAKLTIAVNALEYYADNCTPEGTVAWKALAEINKIGE